METLYYLPSIYFTVGKACQILDGKRIKSSSTATTSSLEKPSLHNHDDLKTNETTLLDRLHHVTSFI